MVATGVVVVGGGAAGLLAAVVARRLGHDVILVEATGQVGGATAVGDGRMWLPGNDFMGTGPFPADSVEEARRYLDAVGGPPADDVEAARRAAFVRTAGPLARWLTTSKVLLAPVRSLPDELEADGAKAQGRCLIAQAVDPRRLDDPDDRIRGLELRPATAGGPPVIGALRRLSGRVFGGRAAIPAGGAALVTELYRRATGSGVEFWFDAPMTRLLVDGTTVIGAEVLREGEAVPILAGGVILACGGFEAEPELRDQHLPLPTDAVWSASGVSANRGIGLRSGVQAGATTSRLSETWGTPVVVVDEVAHDLEEARCAPHGLIVDQAGDRFFDEADDPVSATRRLYERNRGMRAVPSYLIVDQRHRQAYRLGPWAAGESPRSAQDSGELVRAATLDELAQRLGVDRAGLIGSVVAFNAGAGKGRDTDFARGASPADKARGDAAQRRSPCLGKVDKEPYWAVRVYPGDTGTRGGLRVDESGRVLDGGDDPIPGLYACAGTAASAIPSGYPAPGASLGAALVDAYRAALGLGDQVERLDEALG